MCGRSNWSMGPNIMQSCMEPQDSFAISRKQTLTKRVCSHNIGKIHSGIRSRNRGIPSDFCLLFHCVQPRILLRFEMQISPIKWLMLLLITMPTQFSLIVRCRIRMKYTLCEHSQSVYMSIFHEQILGSLGFPWISPLTTDIYLR